MATDRNRAKLRGNVAPQWPAGVSGPIVPEMPHHDWESTDLVSTSSIRAEQQAIKEGVNVPSMREQLAAGNGRQTPNPDANAAVFQPTSGVEYSGAKIVGDLVAGPPKGNLGRDVNAVVGGTLMAGGTLPKPRDPRVVLKDFPKDETKTFVNNAPNAGQG